MTLFATQISFATQKVKVTIDIYVDRTNSMFEQREKLSRLAPVLFPIFDRAEQYCDIRVGVKNLYYADIKPEGNNLYPLGTPSYITTLTPQREALLAQRIQGEGYELLGDKLSAEVTYSTILKSIFQQQADLKTQKAYGAIILTDAYPQHESSKPSSTLSSIRFLLPDTIFMAGVVGYEYRGGNFFYGADPFSDMAMEQQVEGEIADSGAVTEDAPFCAPDGNVPMNYQAETEPSDLQIFAEMTHHLGGHLGADLPGLEQRLRRRRSPVDRHIGGFWDICEENYSEQLSQYLLQLLTYSGCFPTS